MTQAPMPFRELLRKCSSWTLVSSQRRWWQSFLAMSGPAVNCSFPVLASARPLRAQCTQNYNVIAQAGAE